MYAAYKAFVKLYNLFTMTKICKYFGIYLGFSLMIAHSLVISGTRASVCLNREHEGN